VGRRLAGGLAALIAPRMIRLSEGPGKETTLLKKIICSLVAAAFILPGAVAQSPAVAPAGPSQSIDERLGPDDGAAFAILFTANIRGNLETCD
jgi:hypothetical protein